MRLIFYVEGKTEQQYVRQVLAKHLAQFGITDCPAILPPTGKKRGRVFKGGGDSYAKLRRHFRNLLREHGQADVRFTTMFDLYGLFSDFPGRDTVPAGSDPQARARHLESAFHADFNDPRVIPHLQPHEFETLLFCGPEHAVFFLESPVELMQSMRDAVAENGGMPELINDSAQTAPSKRIIRYYPQYKNLKATDGVDWADVVGLDAIRRQCPHFHEWLTRLETLVAPANPTNPEPNSA